MGFNSGFKGLSPLLLLAHVNDMWSNNESNIRLFADDCIICRKQWIVVTDRPEQIKGMGSRK